MSRSDATARPAESRSPRATRAHASSSSAGTRSRRRWEELAQGALGQLDGAQRLAAVEREARAAQLRRGAGPRRVEQASNVLGGPEPAQLGERREGPPVIPGREREKSSIDASSTRSASRHRPRQRWTAPYSARQNASMYRLP